MRLFCPIVLILLLGLLPGFAKATDAEIVLHPLPNGIDSEAGVAISEDGSVITAFLSDNGATSELKVFTPEAGVRTALVAVNPYWITTSHHGTYALAASNIPSQEKYRLHIPTGTFEPLPPLPTGLNSNNVSWQWIGNDGVALALASRIVNGVITRLLLKLHADLSGYDEEELTGPAPIQTLIALSDEDSVQVDIRNDSVWPYITRNGIQQHPIPDTRLSFGNRRSLSKDGNWLLDCSINYSNQLFVRRWNLASSAISEPETVELPLSNWGVNPNGTVFGGKLANGYYTARPFVWLPNGALMDVNNLNLNQLGNGNYLATEVLAVSTDQQILAGAAQNNALQKALWVQRRETPIHREPRSPRLELSDDSGPLYLGWRFGVTAAGQGLKKVLRLTNRGELNARNLEFEIRGAGSASFAVTKTWSTVSLSPADSITFDVTFTAPNDRGHYAELLVHSESSNSPFIIPLAGGIVTRPTVTLESPLGTAVAGNITFPPTQLGEVATREIFLRNTSTTLTLRDPDIWALESGDSDVFRVSYSAPITLEPGQIGSIILEYHPTAAGINSGNFYFRPSAADITASTSFSLTGHAGPQPYLLVKSPNGRERIRSITHDVSSIETNRVMSYDFVVTNKSLMPLDFDQPVVVGLNPVVLAKTHLEHDESMVVTVTTHAGLIRRTDFSYFTSNLNLYRKGEADDRTKFPIASLNMNFQSITPFVAGPVIQVKDLSGVVRPSNEITVDFGERTVNTSLQKILLIKNISNALSNDPLNIQSFAHSPFNASSNHYMLNVGDEIELRLVFTPNAVGQFHEQLHILSNALNTPDYMVNLRGHGVSGGPPVFLHQPESRFGFEGQPIWIIPTINGDRPMVLELIHPRKGIIAKSTNHSGLETLNIAKLAGYHAGELRIRARNNHGETFSQPFYLGVVTQDEKPPYKRTMIGGQTLNLSFKVAGEQVRFQWFKDNVPLQNGNKVSNAESDTLKISNIREADSGIYHCEVTFPGLFKPQNWAYFNYNVHVIEKPKFLFPDPLPELMAGNTYHRRFYLLGAPSKVKIEGLPTGLRATYLGDGIIEFLGELQEAAGFEPSSAPFILKVTATNAAGTSILTRPWIVNAPTPAPVLNVPDHLPDAIAGADYEYIFDVINGYNFGMIKGLPPGLKQDDDGGLFIKGRPLMPIKEPVKITVTAKNFAGSVTKDVWLKVNASSFAGHYEMNIRGSHYPDGQTYLGGRLSLTLTSAGICTWQFRWREGYGGRYKGIVAITEEGFTLNQEVEYRQGPNDKRINGLKTRLILSADQLGIRGTIDLQQGGNEVEGYKVSNGSLTRFAGNYTALLTHVPPSDSTPWLQVSGTPVTGRNKIKRYTTGYERVGSYHPSTNVPAVYETKNRASVFSHPGSRFGSFTWTDRDGLLHLFGGSGDWFFFRSWDEHNYSGAEVINATVHADHWVFDPKTMLWIWQSGNKTGSGNPHPSAKVAGLSPYNFPGARTQGVSWVDANGDFWLFGGIYSDKNKRLTFYNDLWRFVPSLKAWEQVMTNGSADYGIKGVASAKNQPPSRMMASGWSDPEGNFWLFGGASADSTGKWNVYGDLWKFDTVNRQWIWTDGSKIIGDRSNTDSPTPTSRATVWPDPETGNVHMYCAAYDDLWLWNHATKTWRLIIDDSNAPSSVIRPRSQGPVVCHWRTTDGRCWLQFTRQRFHNLSYSKDYTWCFDPKVGTWSYVNGDTDPYPCIQEYNQVRSAGMTWNTGDDEFWHYGGQSRDWLPYLYYDFMFRRGKARLPKAPGWISAKVSSKGVVNWAGRLGDGAPILGSSALGLTGADDGSRSFLISYVRKDEVLSAQGLVTLTPDLSDTLLSGHFEAVENFANLAKRDRTFRAGLPVHSVTVDGGRYRQPANGQNMFTSVAPANIDLALPDSQQPLLIPINLGRDAASSAASQLKPPYTSIKLNIIHANGVISGTATLKDPHPSNPEIRLTRDAIIHGVILSGDQKAAGYMLLPDLPAPSRSFIPPGLSRIQGGTWQLSPSDE